jgi:hypothetical protein
VKGRWQVKAPGDLPGSLPETPKERTN